MPERLETAIDRCLRLQDVLAAGEQGFTVLRQRLALPAPTLARLLKALTAAGLVASSRNGYRLAPRAVATARRVVGGQDLAETLAEVLAELSRRTGESAAFYAWREDRPVLIAVHEAPESFRYAPVGIAVPELTRHGFALACVAQLGVGDHRAAHGRCPRRKERPFTWFRDQLAAARHLGAAIELGEHRSGVLRVAAPVGRTAVLGAIGVSSPRCEAIYAKTLLPQVLNAAKAAAELLSSGTHP